MYCPSPTLISTFAVEFAAAADSLLSRPRRGFLHMVAMTVPGSVAARGDPFWELYVYIYVCVCDKECVNIMCDK